MLGGGVIGCEFASVWRSFGAEVTIVEALPHLVPLEDEQASKLLERAFRKRGIDFELGARFAGVEKTENGVTGLAGERQDDRGRAAARRRRPRAGLPGARLRAGRRRDGARLRQGRRATARPASPTISAVGDLIPTLQLAHVGFGEGILVAERLAGLDPAPIDYDGVPRVTYSEPEVASVGITEARAKEKYGDDGVETVTYDLAGNGKSQILKTAGFVKLVRQKDGPVVGVHMVGSRVGELVAEAQLIYNWEAYPDEVAQLIHAHPTQTEAVGEAHLALAGKPLHAHG